MGKTKDIVIDAFKAGKYPQGEFTAKELSEIASTYDPEHYEAPILIGHLSDPAYQGKSTIPAFGWIGKVKVVGDHLKLVVSQFSEQLKSLIKEGFYKKVSAAFFQPDDPNNPTPGKWHLHHLAFLGGVAPAVKGLEQIAFFEMTSKGIEFAEMDVAMDGEVIDEVEGMGKVDTLNDLAEYCGNFLKKVEDALSAKTDMETCHSRMNLAAYDLQSEIHECMEAHFNFVSKLENIEEKKEMEMSEKKHWLVEMAGKVQAIITNRKGKEVDAQKEQSYQQEIAALKADKDALQGKVTQFEEAKRTAEQEKAAADLLSADNALKADIKTFCDTQVKEGKMTPAIRAKDEPIMFTLGKSSPEALKAFQEKYNVAVVPLGEVAGSSTEGDNRSQVIKSAEKYVIGHPKEFSGLAQDQAIARAVYLQSVGQIKFESTN